MSGVEDSLREHLDEGSPATLARLFDAIRQEPTFDAGTPWHQRANELLEQERHDEVIRLIEAAMPGAFLSPDAHLMLSYAYEQIHADDRSRLESFHARTALDVIERSGSGTRERPWKVLRVVDEYAVLRDLQLAPVGQRLVEADGREFDVHELSDGSQRWFELG